MKDLGPSKQIPNMKITYGKKNKELWLSQENYIEKFLERFNISKAKLVISPLGHHFKLSQNPISEKDKELMKKMPYASAVGGLIYTTVYTKPNITHVSSFQI